MTDKDLINQEKIRHSISFDKELRVLAKRSALVLSVMSRKSRLTTI